ncbi:MULTISPECIES: ABC transporter ATP-binding protein [Paenibacillus]|uniref:ABC transporter ATP-binding protein n=1 Tax=Paenibacillus TaxID=44249 RepID=UPI001CA7C954|nr:MULTISPECIES: ABC transporter ATP-binding protein [Paenibacillus]
MKQLSEPLLSIENIGQAYKTRRGVIDAIKDLSFDIQNSEFVCVVGPSGCGKSTLIYTISGINSPTSGRIRLKGKEVKGTSQEIGMVFQKYSAFPWMTVEKNVSYGPRMNKMSRSEVKEVTNRYIEMVGLKGYEHLYPKELSGGMSKRVDIARAYANSPSILLMDEPFAALDDLTKKQMQIELLKIWASEKKTVVFVTHDLEEALFLADRILIMKRSDNGSSSKHSIVEVPFPRPRSAELRITPEFANMKKYLMGEIGK